MNILKAKKIVKEYTDVILENTKDGEILVLETKCQYNKNQVFIAFKILVSHYTVFKYLTTEENQNMYLMINRVNSLTNKSVYEDYKKLHKRVKEKGLFKKKPTQHEINRYIEYFKLATQCKEHDEIIKLQADVQSYITSYIKAEKSLIVHEPYEYIYKLIGIEYELEYGQLFYEEGVKSVNNIS